MRSLVYLIVTVSITVFPAFVFGQNAKEDMQAMNTFYNGASSFKSDIQVKIFTDKSDSSPLIQTAKVRKDGKRFFSELGDVKMLLSENSLLMIYEKDKRIIYRGINQKDYEAYMKSFFAYNLDSIISSYDSILYKGTENDQKEYRIYNSKGQINKTELYLNSSTGAMNKVVYFYNEKLWGSYYKVVISFINQGSISSAERNLFSEKKYITGSGKNVKVSSEYINYHLINTNYED
jgi:hypothetical protein